MVRLANWAILAAMGILIGISSDSMSVGDGRSGRHERRVGAHKLLAQAQTAASLQSKTVIVFIKKPVADAVFAAGGLPVIIPFANAPSQAKATVKNLDGLIISGGNFDISPSLFGEKPHKKLGVTVRQRTLYELALLKAAIAGKKPVLGICGGHQLINVHFGGTLYQDICSQATSAKDHEQKSDPRKTSHTVNIEKNSRLERIVKKRSLRVNSTHHQAVKELGKGLTTGAVSPDGIVEALEAADDRFILGVQWHPEFLTRMEPQLKIFRSFIKSCAARR